MHRVDAEFFVFTRFNVKLNVELCNETVAFLDLKLSLFLLHIQLTVIGILIHFILHLFCVYLPSVGF